MRIIDRKQELILRDPLGIEYVRKKQTWLKNLPKFDLLLYNSIHEITEKLNRKWKVNLWGIKNSGNSLDMSGESYEFVEDPRNYEGQIVLIKGKFRSFSFAQDNSIYCPYHKIPIIIDPSILTINDARKVKNAVWNIVKKEINKRIKDITNKWNQSTPKGESKELGKLIHCRNDTFRKYLKWYDLHIEGFPFRLIAYIELSIKDKEKQKAFYQQQGSKQRKLKLGKRIKGESAVRNAYNIVYEAIHRKSPSDKEENIPSVIEPYNCPQHGHNCEEDFDCDYMKKWLNDFSKSHKPYGLKEKLL